MEAKFYEKADNKNVVCTLCPHDCLIADGKLGFCRARENEDGILNTLNYGKVSAIGVEPIEKAPLFHYYPGQEILSIGTIGCSMKCSYCRTHQIAHYKGIFLTSLHVYTSNEIIDLVLAKTGNIGIAYTYNEPMIWYEFVQETARLAKSKGLKNVMVSNGYIKSEPLAELLPFIDAFNIDLKAFSEEAHQTLTRTSLEPVKQCLKAIKSSGKHLELSFLLIPKKNDDENQFRDMLDWIRFNLGRDTVLHLPRYFPNYKETAPATSPEVLSHFYDIAKQYLNYVYTSNVPSAEHNSTFCKDCNSLMVERNGVQVNIKDITEEGTCKKCGTDIFGL